MKAEADAPASNPLPQHSALLASPASLCASLIHLFIHSFSLWAMILLSVSSGFWGSQPEQGRESPLRELALSAPDTSTFCLRAFVHAVLPS